MDETIDNKQKKLRDISSDLRASELRRKGTQVTLVNMVVGLVPRIYWDFCDNTISRDCREESQKEKNNQCVQQLFGGRNLNDVRGQKENGQIGWGPLEGNANNQLQLKSAERPHSQHFQTHSEWPIHYGTLYW